MDTNRAKQISQSSVMANVTYQGVPIYIQEVNEQNGIARVYDLDNPQQQQEISVNQLAEH